MPAVVVDERRLRRLPVEAFTSEAKEGMWDLAVAKGHSTYNYKECVKALSGYKESVRYKEKFNLY